MVYDEGNDYVIELEKFDEMLEPNTIQESNLKVFENKNLDEVLDVVIKGFISVIASLRTLCLIVKFLM